MGPSKQYPEQAPRANLGADVMAYFQSRMEREPELAALVQEERAKLALTRSLQDLRRERGLSRGQLAKKAKTKRSIIRAIERGKASLKLKVLWRIVTALGAHLTITPAQKLGDAPMMDHGPQDLEDSAPCTV